MTVRSRVATAPARPPDGMEGRGDKAPVMSARHKLNAAYAAGSLLLAALIGGAAQSVIVFVVALVALLSLDFVAGNIRQKGHR